MAFTIGRHFDVTLTQGSADAFVQGTVATELVPADGLAYVITRLEVARTYTLPAASSFLEYSLSRDTKSAICTLDDDDCLYYGAVGTRFTTSGQTVDPLVERIDFPYGIFVVEPYIYCQLDSTSTALTQVVKMRMWYEQQKVSELEILRLLNNV